MTAEGGGYVINRLDGNSLEPLVPKSGKYVINAKRRDPESVQQNTFICSL